MAQKTAQQLIEALAENELLGNRVIVLKDFEEKTPGGIIIPPTQDDDMRPNIGTVVATAKGDAETPMNLSVGQRVMYGKYAGSEIELEGTKVYIMTQSDVLMKLKK